jgi:hypothetical protein
VDIEPRERPAHPRISYLTGSSIDPAVLRQIELRVGAARKVIVILDSDHSFEHVCAELDAYGRFVSEESYLIVEDTNLSGHPVHPEQDRGPMESVRQFLEKNSGFVPDRSREKYLLTFNPLGYLKRTSAASGATVEHDIDRPLPGAPREAPGQTSTASLSALATLFEQMVAQRDRAAADLNTATSALVDAVGALSKIGAHGISLNESMIAQLGRVTEHGQQLEALVARLQTRKPG